MSHAPRILVTGAGGFIGGRIVELACAGRQYQVRAGVRNWSSAARIARYPVEICRCDLNDDAQIRSALDGVDAVIHCALGDRVATVEGTRRLAQAALSVGVSRFVHLSTCDVYGTNEGLVDEAQPLVGYNNAYSTMKVAAEQVCWELHARGLPLCVLRPTIVYGPFSKAWSIRTAARIASRRWGELGAAGSGRCNLIYVDDLANAALHAIAAPTAVGQAFNVNGNDDLTWNEYWSRFSEALGQPLPKMNAALLRARSSAMTPLRWMAHWMMKHFREPIFNVYQRSSAARGAMQATESGLGATPTLDELQLYRRRVRFANDKLVNHLGVAPAIDVTRGLSATVAWLRFHGFVGMPR